ncbi:MAG: SDR family NAD(P)-dependent oxidoreductase, partial [Stellaceae bacterium]
MDRAHRVRRPDRAAAGSRARKHRNPHFGVFLRAALDGHAIVTGGSSGIGLATARLLAQHGMDVTLIARRAALLGDAVAALEGLRRRPVQSIRAIPADL